MGRIDSETMYRCLALLRASLPMDTGNLRFNATTISYRSNGFELSVGGAKAPYFEFLQDKEYFENQFGKSKKKNPYHNTFENRNFTPVFRYLESTLKGKFGGGRFLQQHNVLQYSDRQHHVMDVLQNQQLEARDAVASRYGGL